MTTQTQQWLLDAKIVFVVGDREFDNREAVWRVLRDLYFFRPDALLVRIGMPGASQLARVYAKSNGRALLTAEVDWGLYGTSAEAEAERWVFDILRPQLVIAFIDGNNLPAVKCARHRNIPVLEVLG